MITLELLITRLVNEHFKYTSNLSSLNLRQVVIEEIEPIILRIVMERCHYNQKKAALILGISRTTCRKLLIKYFDKKYCSVLE
ncbi:helix-turn-helix domain-containing protein [Fluoribacter gormanii]|uniref:helix-turn-helix domain-containing protein n=1 Tax=Fluoribacter gormanii TaxID=464 RepID=UPI00104109BE